MMNKDFLWGGSVSAQQTEGAHDLDGKSMSVYDGVLSNSNDSIWNDAIDFYHHFKEDIQLLKELGLKAYRFSISWARVITDGDGAINEKGLKFYDEVVDELLKANIEPIICLHHFDLPLNIFKKHGGWESKESIKHYLKYSEVVIKRFSKRVKYWIPFNEINAGSVAQFMLFHPDFNKKEIEKRLPQVLHNMLLAQAECIKIIRNNSKNSTVIGMVNFTPVYPDSSHPTDVMNAQFINQIYNFDTLDVMCHGTYPKSLFKKWKKEGIQPTITPSELNTIVENTIDVVGFSYYMSIITQNRNTNSTILDVLNTFLKKEKTNPFLQESQWGWTIDPIGLRVSMNMLYSRYNKPLFILENGIGVNEDLNEYNTVEDDYRIDYFKKHIEQIKHSIEDDLVDCIGYCVWAPMDIPSSQGDMNKRYGMIYVNRTNESLLDLKRYKKKSFYWFKNMIESE